MTTWKTKLHPSRFPGMSPKMAAIVGCITGETYTQPALVELSITADGFVLGRVGGDCGLNEWIGTADDFRRNWRSLLEAAGLTERERQEAEAHRALAVMDWRQAPAFVAVEDSRG